MKLIIAEKPSQAREYAKALGGFTTKDGYMQSSQYYLTWCFGHLVELERDTKYREGSRWGKSYLPLIPIKYRYRISSDAKGNIDTGKKKQLNIIKNLMNKSTELINGTDADREGELIFLYVYNFLECKLPFKRLWISSLTKGDIIKGFQNLRPQEEMYHLGKSAYARAIADWLVGINGTQAATLQFSNGGLLTIGRVQTAILKIICERYLKNKNFTKSYSYSLRAKHQLNIPFHSETEVYETKTDAEQVLNTLSNQHKCIKIEKKIQKKSAPLLFSIDTLIVESNKRYGYTGQETLDTAQKLYEKKLTSYPRTDSEYINEENFAKIKGFLPQFAQDILNVPFSFCIDKPKSVNDKKLTGSHDAIVPTGEISNLNSLTEKELNIFELVIQRCLQSFSAAAEYEKTKITFDNTNVPFFTYGSKLLVKGWKIYETTENKEQTDEQEFDIQIQENDIVNVEEFELKEIESKPPALYSEVNLTKDLTNFGKLLKEEDPDTAELIESVVDINSLQIGTQATRPSIIERLKKLDFIRLQKNKFIPTEKGLKYYEVVKDLQVSNVITTAIWEMKLKKVAEGKEDIQKFYKAITTFTEEIVNDIFSKEVKVQIGAEKREDLGTCPKCKKGKIYEGKKSFGCSEWQQGCNFSIWKTIAGKKISSTAIKDLLTKDKTRLIKGFTSKKGSKFDASLKLDKDFKVIFDFNKK